MFLRKKRLELIQNLMGRIQLGEKGKKMIEVMDKDLSFLKRWRIGQK